MRRLVLLVLALSLPVASAASAADACLLVLECETPAPSTTTSTTAPVAAPPATAPGPAADHGDPSATLLELANAARADAGVAPLAAAPSIESIAAGWSAVMADRGALAHNDDYFTPGVRSSLGASMLGENVAFAGDIATAHATLMDSPHHRDNLLDARFTVVGMAAVLRDGRWWVTQDFAQVRAVSAAAAPAPAPAPTPRSRDASAAEVPRSGTENEVVGVVSPVTSTTVAVQPNARESAKVGSTSEQSPPAPAPSSSGPVGLAVLALTAAAGLVVQRSWASASQRIRWSRSPWRTSSGWGSPVLTIAASSDASVAKAAGPTAAAQSISATPPAP
jgi:uncharacterized protein YkwD